MPEIRQQYLLDSNSVEAIQRVFNMLMDRLDEIEGLRGTPTFHDEATFTASATGINASDISGLGAMALIADATSDGGTYGRKNGAWSAAVAGPATAGDSHVAMFDGTTGKLLKDSTLHLAGNNTGDQDLSTYALLTGSADIEITDSAKGLILKSPDASRWRITVNNAGALVVTKL